MRRGPTGDDVELVGVAEVEMVILLPIVEYVVQDDVLGAGCGGGVAGSPW